MRCVVHVMLLASLLGLGGAPACADVPVASIVRVRAVSADGGTRFGSAVVIGTDTLATACHVTRRSTTIELSQRERRWVVQTQSGSITHDLCVLTVHNLDLPTAHIRDSKGLALGDRVHAAGFEHGGANLISAAGTVQALYPYDSGFVIRTSARFDFGSSGGGLFDDDGNLVGLLAFKARTGQNLGFALPSDWMDSASRVALRFEPVVPASIETAFWERAQSERPQFLGAALREAAQSAQ